MTQNETQDEDAWRDLARLADEMAAEIDGLRREVEIVYDELVLPCWGDPDYHGLPRTLYGYIMATFSFADLLSQHCYSHRQTVRMRMFLEHYMRASPEAAAVAVQLWRHTLMHTANPRRLVDRGSQRTYRWLVHWREHLPRQHHMRFQRLGSESILNVGLLYLIDDLADGARGALADAAKAVHLRDRFLDVSRGLSVQGFDL